MKRSLKLSISVATLLLLCIGLAAACGKKDPDGGNEQKEEGTKPSKTYSEFTLSLMTFNIAVDNQSAETGWEARKGAVVKMLNKVKPMLIGLQEAQAHEITYLSKHGPKYARYGIGRDSGKSPSLQDNYAAEETMMIMWLPDSLEALKHGTFWLSKTPETPGIGWDAACNRNVNWIHFRHKVTKQEFFFFNTHLDHKGSTAREESIKLINDRMKELNPDGLPVFLSADFNAKQGNKIFAPIKEWMKSNRDVAPDSDASKNTFNGYSAPKSQIDHIFFYEGKEGKVKPLTFKVLDDNYGATWISDHFPVVATYRYSR